jgi:hypothetical protein
MQAVLEQGGFAARAIENPEELKGRKIGLFGKLVSSIIQNQTRAFSWWPTSINPG